MDEQEIASAIEKECGSPMKAERLNYIWKQTLGVCSRIERFRKIAKLEGFTSQAIQLFLTGD